MKDGNGQEGSHCSAVVHSGVDGEIPAGGLHLVDRCAVSVIQCIYTFGRVISIQPTPINPIKDFIPTHSKAYRSLHLGPGNIWIRDGNEGALGSRDRRLGAWGFPEREIREWCFMLASWNAVTSIRSERGRTRSEAHIKDIALSDPLDVGAFEGVSKISI